MTALQASIISIHKALASLDEDGFPRLQVIDDFNPQGSREPRLAGVYTHTMKRDISIHKALASLDEKTLQWAAKQLISIHKALASLDDQQKIADAVLMDFNPQGSREPRRP